MENSKPLLCPKCGSNQLAANKKGFSGRKAVAGAVLTGGIGILAGTIGSNKIKITCLACGHQFYPGQDLEAVRRKTQQDLETLKSPITWIVFFGIIVFLFFGLRSCFKAADNTDNSENYSSITTLTDSSHYFIRTVLNCTPKEASRILGKSDNGIQQSNDCSYLPNCNSATYKNGEYEVLYYKNKLKQITISQKGLVENAIEYIGFKNCKPTFSNPPNGIFWRNSETKATGEGPLIPIKGLREVCTFPEYILVSVEKDYNKKF